jgi:hypothetical protein
LASEAHRDGARQCAADDAEVATCVVPMKPWCGMNQL